MTKGVTSGKPLLKSDLSFRALDSLGIGGVPALALMVWGYFLDILGRSEKAGGGFGLIVVKFDYCLQEMIIQCLAMSV